MESTFITLMVNLNGVRAVTKSSSEMCWVDDLTMTTELNECEWLEQEFYVPINDIELCMWIYHKMADACDAFFSLSR